jgi:hypothetical protein
MFLKIRTFIPLAVAITCLCGLVYLTAQQNYRMSANDPQIQISEDVARALSNGAKPDDIIGARKVDIAKSLAPFVIIYDNTEKMTTSNAALDDKNPELASGVLGFAKSNKQNRLTWQPKEGVRIAAVVTRFDGTSSGFVLAGRNMREVEIREDRLFLHVFAAWLITMAATFLATLIFIPTPRKK